MTVDTRNPYFAEWRAANVAAARARGDEATAREIERVPGMTDAEYARFKFPWNI